MRPHEPLAAAVDRLYAAFGAVRRPTAIAQCPCCCTPEEAAAVLAPVPLPDLDADTLRPYAAHVLLTVGDVADFRYYLPRIFEIAATSGFAWPDLEPLAGRLRLAEWSTWAADEQAAIRGLLRALWTRTLADGDAEPDADSVLCAIGNAEDDLTPYLEEWTAALRRPPAAAALWDLLCSSTRLPNGTVVPTNPFWNGRGAPIGRWLDGGELRAAVADAFAATDIEEDLRVLADIDSLLETRA